MLDNGQKMKPEVKKILVEESYWIADAIRAIVMEFHIDNRIKKASIRHIKDAPEDWVSIEYGRFTLKYDYDKNIIFVG